MLRKGGDAAELFSAGLATEGAIEQSAEARKVLTESTFQPHTTTHTSCGEERLRLQRGTTFTSDEYVGAERYVGPLPIECVDLGETLKLTLSSGAEWQKTAIWPRGAKFFGLGSRFPGNSPGDPGSRELGCEARKFPGEFPGCASKFPGNPQGGSRGGALPGKSPGNSAAASDFPGNSRGIQHPGNSPGYSGAAAGFRCFLPY